jgi:hypothetical protein
MRFRVLTVDPDSMFSFLLLLFHSMKKILFLITLSIMTVSSMASVYAESVTFDNGANWSCDQYFAPVPLRYWYNYTFHDTFNNPTGQNTYLNTFEIQYKNANYLAADGVFSWTQDIRNAGFTVAPGSSIRALTTNPNW